MRALGVHVFAGGFTLGVERHFEVLAHLERGSLGVRSWRGHRPGVPSEVSKAAAWSLERYGQVDFVYGNPPCASWSAASRTMKRDGDSLSGDWARDVVAVGAAVGARVVAIESVRGAYLKGAQVYRDLADERGMKLAWVFVNAVDHGLPQVRPRVFMLFSRGDIFVPEAPDIPRRSVTETIAGAPTDVPMDASHLRYSRKHGVTPADVEACIPIIPPGKQLRNMDPEEVRKVSPVVADYMLRSGWPFGVKSPVRCPADDSPTIVVFGNNPKFIHPTEDRLLTMRELLRLQGYPDDFTLREVSVPEDLIVMGKTVCPPVGEWLAGEVAAHLRGERRVLRGAREEVFWCASDARRPLSAPRAAEVPGASAQDEPEGEEDAFLAALPAQAESTGRLVTSGAPAATRETRGRLTRNVGERAQLPGVEVDPDWERLPGPTSLARLLIARGAGDGEVLAATGAVFSRRTEGPHLFTRADLQKLRERIAKREASA